MFIKTAILKTIRFYQLFLSPCRGIFNLLGPGPVCRFYPSCSEYCYLAVEKYGVLFGIWKGVKRILRCHPFCPGGVDMP